MSDPASLGLILGLGVGGLAVVVVVATLLLNHCSRHETSALVNGHVPWRAPSELTEHNLAVPVLAGSSSRLERGVDVVTRNYITYAAPVRLHSTVWDTLHSAGGDLRHDPPHKLPTYRVSPLHAHQDARGAPLQARRM